MYCFYDFRCLTTQIFEEQGVILLVGISPIPDRLREIRISVVDSCLKKELQTFNHRFDKPEFRIKPEWTIDDDSYHAAISDAEPGSGQGRIQTRRLAFLLKNKDEPAFMCSFKIKYSASEDAGQ